MASRDVRTTVRALVLAAVIAGATILNQSAVHWRTNSADSDLFAYYGWCLTRGARPYLDVWDNKPPGIWWVNAGAIRLCGTGSGSELPVGAVPLVISLVAFLAIARTAYHRTVWLPAALVAAVLLTDLRFESGANRTETWVVACETTAVLGYLQWLRRRRWTWLLAGAVAAGTAPLFKQSGLAAAAACAVHLAWTQWRGRASLDVPRRHVSGWRPWAIAAAGLIAAPLAAMIALAWQGALGEAVYAIAVFNRAYFAVDDATWWRLGRVWPVYRPVLELIAGVFAVAGIGLAAGVYARFRRLYRVRMVSAPYGTETGCYSRAGVGLFVLWFVLAAYLAFVGPGRRGHHFMPALPALGLLALYPVHLVAARRGLRAALLARPGAALGVVLGAYVFLLVFVGSLAEADRCWRTKAHWYALDRARPSACERQAAAIVRLTQPADLIYVWGWSPGTYRHACRRPASRYATFEKLGQVGRYADFIFEHGTADIRRNRPRVVALGMNDYERLIGPPRNDFAAWLATDYEPVTTVEGMNLLLRTEK
jgi:hypothetical protein